MTFREFYQKILMLNIADYENLTLDLNINIVILALGIGIAIAVAASGVFRSTIFTLIKQLTRHEASSPATAKTLSSMSLTDKRFIRALKSLSQVKAMVAYVGEPAEIKNKKYHSKNALTEEAIEPQESENENGKEKIDSEAVEIDSENTLFYLRESGADRAKKVLERYDASFIGSIIFASVILVIAVCVMFLVPSILELLNSIVGAI